MDLIRKVGTSPREALHNPVSQLDELGRSLLDIEFLVIEAAHRANRRVRDRDGDRERTYASHMARMRTGEPVAPSNFRGHMMV